MATMDIGALLANAEAATAAAVELNEDERVALSAFSRGTLRSRELKGSTSTSTRPHKALASEARQELTKWLKEHGTACVEVPNAVRRDYTDRAAALGGGTMPKYVRVIRSTKLDDNIKLADIQEALEAMTEEDLTDAEAALGHQEEEPVHKRARKQEEPVPRARRGSDASAEPRLLSKQQRVFVHAWLTAVRARVSSSLEVLRLSDSVERGTRNDILEELPPIEAARAGTLFLAEFHVKQLEGVKREAAVPATMAVHAHEAAVLAYMLRAGITHKNISMDGVAYKLVRRTVTTKPKVTITKLPDLLTAAVRSLPPTRTARGSSSSSSSLFHARTHLATAIAVSVEALPVLVTHKPTLTRVPPRGSSTTTAADEQDDEDDDTDD